MRITPSSRVWPVGGLLLLSGWLAGCTVTPEQANASLAEEERVVCIREVPTGTMGFRTTCRTVADMRLQRAAVQQQMEQVRGPGTRD